MATQFHHQANGRVDEVWHHHGSHDPNFSGWPAQNISDRHYGYAPDGRLTWENHTGDGGASGSALEDEQGENYRYGADGSLGAFGSQYGLTWQSADSHGDSDANAANFAGAPGAGGPGSYIGSYQYDGAGNRSNVTQMGYQVSYGADAENRYFGSGYDGNSNTTDSRVGWTYAYNAQGQMTSARRQSDHYTVSFGYDGAGRLIFQNTGVPVIFCYAGAQRIEERLCSNNAPLYRYFFDAPGGDQMVFRADASNQRLYYQYDAAGNTSHLTDDAGTVREQYLYDAYGTPSVYDRAGNYLGQSSPLDNRYLFHGASAYEWLAAPGLYYCRARMYLPLHGRWLQPDPIGFAGGDMNLYRYCGNDSVDNTDPTGTSALNTLGHIVGGIWTLPNSVLGLGLGLAGLPFGASFGGMVGGHYVSPISPGGNLQIVNNPIVTTFAAAITLGQVENYGDPSVANNADPNYVGASVYNSPFNVSTGLHEDGHVPQEEILGPLFLPAFLLLEIPKLVLGNRYTNPLESNADNAGKTDIPSNDPNAPPPPSSTPPAANDSGTDNTTNISSYVTGSGSNSGLFTDPSSPYFGASRWDILGIGNQVDSNAVGLHLFTVGGGGGAFGIADLRSMGMAYGE